MLGGGGGGGGGVNHCLISLCNHTNECKIQTTLDREINKPLSPILSKANQVYTKIVSIMY